MTLSIRQNSKILDVTYIIEMEGDEAWQLIHRGQGLVDELDEVLRELHDRNGWKAAGFASWDACVQSEFNISKRRANQLIQLGRVKKNLLPSGDVSGKHVSHLEPNARQAVELAKLPAAAQREVWEASVTTAKGKPTAKSVAEQVNLYRGVTRPSPKPLSKGRKAVSRDDLRARCKALLDTCSDRLAQEVYDLLQERLEGVS